MRLQLKRGSIQRHTKQQTNKQQSNANIVLELKDLLPHKSDAEARASTRHFLTSVVQICLDFIERENDRSEKVIDFYQPREMMAKFDFELPEVATKLDKLIEDCAHTLKYQVNTGK